MPPRSRLALRRLVLWLGGGVFLALAWLLVRDGGRRASVEPEKGSPPPVAAAADPLPSLAEVRSVPGGTGVAQRDALAPAPPALDEEPRGAWLRLLERDTGAPLAGLAVRLLVFDPRLAPDARPVNLHIPADPEGRLDLHAALPESHPLLRVHASPYDARLGFTPGSFEWKELGATPARALELFLAPRPAARLRGRALDARTGEPLPSLAFHVAGWRAPASAEPGAPPVGSLAHEWLGVGYPLPPEWIVSDAGGGFESSSDHPLGWLLLRTLHEEETRVELAPQGSPVEARFEVGPVVRLDFDPPGGRRPQDFLAGLYRAPQEAGVDEELQEPSSPWAPRVSSWSNAAPVFAGSPPWTRLSHEVLEEPLPSHLILVSRDGAAKGAARIDDFERHRVEPLFVPVVELAALVVRFHRPFGGDDQQCQVFLHDGTSDERLAQRWEGRDHEARFQGLAPGPYRLEIRAEPGFTRELALVLPLAGPLDVELPELRTKGELVLEGEVVTESGQPLDGLDGRAHLLVTVIHAGRGHGAWPVWSSAEPGRGRFRVEGLAPGECRVLASFQSGAFEVEPRLATLTLPGPPLTLRVKDGMPKERFELEVLDPPAEGEVEVQARSADNRLRIHSSTGKEARTQRPDGREALRIELGPYPEGAFESLEVRAEGRRTRTLSRAEFRKDGDVLRAELELARGWAGRLQISAPEGDRRPPAGIVLALDGVPLAPSGADGLVLAEADAKPERLSLVTPGWELIEHSSWDDWGTLFADGSFTLEDGRLDVFLRRVP